MSEKEMTENEAEFLKERTRYWMKFHAESGAPGHLVMAWAQEDAWQDLDRRTP